MGQQIWMTVFALLACAAFAQRGPLFQGETALKTQFITVQPDVKLEVLDWGGTGRNLVLLAGLGNTAHVFDSLGPRLAAHYHVIGITRRGFGQSSAPQTGYDPRRLGDDVVAVLDALHIADPILVGHSIAGEELSAVSTYHPGRAAATRRGPRWGSAGVEARRSACRQSRPFLFPPSAPPRVFRSPSSPPCRPRSDARSRSPAPPAGPRPARREVR